MPSLLGRASTSNDLETQTYQYFCVAIISIITFMRFLEEKSTVESFRPGVTKYQKRDDSISYI